MKFEQLNLHSFQISRSPLRMANPRRTCIQMVNYFMLSYIRKMHIQHTLRIYFGTQNL